MCCCSKLANANQYFSVGVRCHWFFTTRCLVHIPLSACEGKLNCHCALCFMYTNIDIDILLHSFYSRVVLSEAAHSNVLLPFKNFVPRCLDNRKLISINWQQMGVKRMKAERLHCCTLRKLSTPPTMYESTRLNEDSMNKLNSCTGGGPK